MWRYFISVQLSVKFITCYVACMCFLLWFLILFSRFFIAPEREGGSSPILRPKAAHRVWRLCGHELWDRWTPENVLIARLITRWFIMVTSSPSRLSFILRSLLYIPVLIKWWNECARLLYHSCRCGEDHSCSRSQRLWSGWATQTTLYQHPGWEWLPHQCSSSIPGTLTHYTWRLDLILPHVLFAIDTPLIQAI